MTQSPIRNAAVASVVALAALLAPFPADAQSTIDPELLEAYAALQAPDPDALAAGREWQRRGDTGLLRLPAARLAAACGGPLGCVRFTPGTSSRVKPFCTIVMPKDDLPDFMAVAVGESLLAECGRMLTVANN